VPSLAGIGGGWLFEYCTTQGRLHEMQINSVLNSVFSSYAGCVTSWTVNGKLREIMKEIVVGTQNLVVKAMCYKGLRSNEVNESF
jgi:hypothetical protein